MKKNFRFNQKGFSLVELIIVIAIMAVLVGVVGTLVIPYLENARRAKDVQILSMYATAGVSGYSYHPDAAIGLNELLVQITPGDATNGDIYSCPDYPDAQVIADEIKTLVNYPYVTNASQDFNSRVYRETVMIEITFHFDDRQVEVIAYDSENEPILNENDVLARL